MTLYEQEVSISYNAESDIATVYTAYPPMIRKLEILLDEYPTQVKLERKTENDLTVKLPKRWVKIKPPRIMSEIQKEQAKERMRKFWENKYNNDISETFTNLDE